MRTILTVALMVGGVAHAADELQTKVEACWSPPRETADASVTVRVDDDGDVLDFGNAEGDATNPAWRGTVEAIARAVRRCAPFETAAGDYVVTFRGEQPRPLGDLDPFKRLD